MSIFLLASWPLPSYTRLVALGGGLEAGAAVVGEGADAELDICGAVWAGSAL